MNKNNDIIIKKLVFKIIQDKNIRNSNITKQLNFFLKTKFETVLQSMQNKFSTHLSDLVIEKLNIDIDDIVTNGMLSEKKFMDSFCEKFNDLIETNYSMNHENFNFDTKYEYVISCFENLCKQPLDEREKEIDAMDPFLMKLGFDRQINGENTKKNKLLGFFGI